MKRPEKMLYQQNKLGYSFVLMYLAFNTVYTIVTLNNMSVNRYIAMEVLVNILISLLAFLAAVKAKNYAVKWIYVILVLGVFQFFRILLISSSLTGRVFINLIIFLVISATCALVGGGISLLKCKLRFRVMHENEQ